MAKKKAARPLENVKGMSKYLQEEKKPVDKKTLLFTVPADTHKRFKEIASSQGISMNRLFDILTRRLFEEVEG